MPPPPQPTNSPVAGPAKSATDVLNPLAAALKAVTEASRGLLAQHTALAQELNQLTTKFDTARSSFRNVVTGVTDAFKTFVSGIEFLKPVTIKISELIRGTFAAVADKLTPILGGIETVVTKAWETVGDKLKPIFGGLVAAVGGTLGGLVTAGGAFAAGLVKVGGVLLDGVKASAQFAGAVAEKLHQFAQQAANALGGVFRAIDAGVMAINQNVTRFVSLVDPAAVYRFQYALDSLYATIGKALVPVINQFTTIMQTLASGVAGAGEQGGKVIAAIAAGTVGLISFAAAMAVVQAVATGGIGPIIGMVMGLFGGVALATGALQPVMTALAETMSGLMGIAGSAMDAIAGAVTAMIPMVTQIVGMMAGQMGYMIEAFQRALPSIMAIVEVVFALTKPFMMLQGMLNAVLIEGLTVVANLLGAWAPLLVLVADALGGAVKIVGHVFMAVVPIMVAVAGAVTDTIKSIIKWVVELVKLIGFEVTDPFAKQNEAAKGPLGQGQMPVRQASFGGVEDVLKKALSASYSLGSGSGDPAKITANNTNSIAAGMGNLNGKVDEVMKWMMNALPHFIISELPAKVYDRMVQVAQDIGNFGQRIANTGIDTGVGKITAGDVAKYATPIGPVIDAAKWANRQLDVF